MILFSVSLCFLATRDRFYFHFAVLLSLCDKALRYVALPKRQFFLKTEHYDKQNHQIMEYKKVQYNIEYELWFAFLICVSKGLRELQYCFNLLFVYKNGYKGYSRGYRPWFNSNVSSETRCSCRQLSFYQYIFLSYVPQEFREL